MAPIKLLLHGTPDRWHNGDSSVFSIPLDPGMSLPVDIPLRIACTNATIWNSWFNVTASDANNRMRYHNGVEWKTVSLPDGRYEIRDFNDALHAALAANNDIHVDESTKIIRYPFDILFNAVQNRVVIRVTTGDGDLVGPWKFDVDKAATLLGGVSGTEITATTNLPNVPDVTNGVSRILLHCSLFDDSLVEAGAERTVAAAFTAGGPMGSLFSYEPTHPAWSECRIRHANEIVVRVTDQSGRPVRTNDTTTLTIVIEDDVPSLMREQVDAIKQLTTSMSMARY